jgi:hypothetical protein
VDVRRGMTPAKPKEESKALPAKSGESTRRIWGAHERGRAGRRQGVDA